MTDEHWTSPVVLEFLLFSRQVRKRGWRKFEGAPFENSRKADYVLLAIRVQSGVSRRSVRRSAFHFERFWQHELRS